MTLSILYVTFRFIHTLWLRQVLVSRFSFENEEKSCVPVNQSLIVPAERTLCDVYNYDSAENVLSHHVVCA